jgi:nucleotide-binding universal stress UspA family protein
MTIMLQKILVPTDFSEHAANAVQAAESLARSTGATLHLLHVVQLPVVPTMPEAAPVVPVAFWQELREHALRSLEKQKARLVAAGVKCELEVIEDVPSFAISAAAERCRADLIVMGSRGLTGSSTCFWARSRSAPVRSAPAPC